MSNDYELKPYIIFASSSNGSTVGGHTIYCESFESAARKFYSEYPMVEEYKIDSILQANLEEDLLPNEILIKRSAVFGINAEGADEDYLKISDWTAPVQYFVGRNGSGKSKAAKALASSTKARFLTTDRLIGLMNVNNFGWGLIPTTYPGVPVGDKVDPGMLEMTRTSGLATSELISLREKPEVLLRVAAFIRRALGRTIELRESAGYLDPYIRDGSTEYSLLRDEGHGLRELVVLLAAIYSDDWKLIIVDEAELHLHPAMARLWLGELIKVCEASEKRAIVITHEPTFLRPRSAEELSSIWVFQSRTVPKRMIDMVLTAQRSRVDSSLAQNPTLVSDIVFSPRPVLVEGIHDVTAFSTVLNRTAPPEAIAQTDLIDCGGSGGVALWLEICIKLGFDVKAVCDLDVIFSIEMQRTIDSLPGISEKITKIFAVGPPKISTVVKPLINESDSQGINKDEKSRGAWLAGISLDEASPESRRKQLLLELLANEGLWLHPQGTLEQVLGITEKGTVQARDAAQKPSPLDDVAAWLSYDLDLHGDVETLLGISVERVAHSIMEALRENPESKFSSPVGYSASSDNSLVRVLPMDTGLHRLEVIAPAEFSGYWLQFSRNTPSSSLTLQPPTKK